MSQRNFTLSKLSADINDDKQSDQQDDDDDLEQSLQELTCGPSTYE